jgi:molybdopterin synthase sulfur carrier subunit
VIRVVLPAHLRTLAKISSEVKIDVPGLVTQRTVLDALEAVYPMLRGTIRDQVTFERRPFVRFFACEQDLSHDPMDALLPEAVASGVEPFLIVGAIAGGAGGFACRTMA